MTALDSKIAGAVAAQKKDGKLPCSTAEQIAANLGVPMADIGRYLDQAKIKITACQLGLFGCSGENANETTNSSGLRAEVLARASNSAITCAAAWHIAAELRATRIQLGDICDTEEVEITDCQLGAF